jgi:hypothetical protein
MISARTERSVRAPFLFFCLLPPVAMRATLLILSLFGLLFVTACGGTVSNAVYNQEGKKVGDIQFENENSATILDQYGEAVGKVRGNIIRDAGSKKLGTVELRDGKVIIIDAEDNEVGTVNNDTECYGQSSELRGTIGTKLDAEAAAAACLILLIGTGQ